MYSGALMNKEKQKTLAAHLTSLYRGQPFLTSKTIAVAAFAPLSTIKRRIEGHMGMDAPYGLLEEMEVEYKDGMLYITPVLDTPSVFDEIDGAHLQEPESTLDNKKSCLCVKVNFSNLNFDSHQ